MSEKGLDTGDKVLAKTLTLKIVHALRQQEKRGKVLGMGKRKGVRVWGLS